jgi:hypothetical protein
LQHAEDCYPNPLSGYQISPSSQLRRPALPARQCAASNVCRSSGVADCAWCAPHVIPPGSPAQRLALRPGPRRLHAGTLRRNPEPMSRHGARPCGGTRCPVCTAQPRGARRLLVAQSRTQARHSRGGTASAVSSSSLQVSSSFSLNTSIAVCTNFGAGPLLSSPIFGAGRLAGAHVASP